MRMFAFIRIIRTHSWISIAINNLTASFWDNQARPSLICVLGFWLISGCDNDPPPFCGAGVSRFWKF